MKRSKFEIISEILLNCSNSGTNITRIVYKVNLNFRVAQQYLDYLVQNEFVEIIENGKKKKYMATKKGKEFVRKFREINDSLP